MVFDMRRLRSAKINLKFNSHGELALHFSSSTVLGFSTPSTRHENKFINATCVIHLPAILNQPIEGLRTPPTRHLNWRSCRAAHARVGASRTRVHLRDLVGI